MNLKKIPGTILEKEKMDNATGMNFLNKVFYITNGIMLGQIREISGIDGTTLQNWVKRGWVGNPTKKTYDKEQLARILIINMMRDTMQLSRVIFLLTYVNGEDERDRIVTESQFYDYICQTLERVASPDSAGLNDLEPMIENVLAEYGFRGCKTPPCGGDPDRGHHVLCRTRQIRCRRYARRTRRGSETKTLNPPSVLIH